MNISSRHNISSLKDRSEIDRVLKSGNKISTRFGPIFLANTQNNDKIRVGILLKKTVGNAVKRNYVKRIIRNFVMHHAELFDHSNRVIFIYNHRKPVNYSMLENEYLRTLQ